MSANLKFLTSKSVTRVMIPLLLCPLTSHQPTGWPRPLVTLYRRGNALLRSGPGLVTTGALSLNPATAGASQMWDLQVCHKLRACVLSDIFNIIVKCSKLNMCLLPSPCDDAPCNSTRDGYTHGIRSTGNNILPRPPAHPRNPPWH